MTKLRIRYSLFAIRYSHSAPTADHAKDHRDQSDHKENVNESTKMESGISDGPDNDQDDGNIVEKITHRSGF